MRMRNLYLIVCLTRKRINISRSSVTVLGNPSHLSFWYDENDEFLYISSAVAEDLDAFEIPSHFWKNTKHSCEVARFAFLAALRYRLGWEDNAKYTYEGVLSERANAPAVVFDMKNGVRVK